MEFLQGRSVETMAAIAVAVVAVAVGGAFLLRRSKKPKGMYVLCSYFTYGQMHACLDAICLPGTRGISISFGGERVEL
jgi:hypothetical protein